MVKQKTKTKLTHSVSLWLMIHKIYEFKKKILHFFLFEHCYFQNFQIFCLFSVVKLILFLFMILIEKIYTDSIWLYYRKSLIIKDNVIEIR